MSASDEPQEGSVAMRVSAGGVLASLLALLALACGGSSPDTPQAGTATPAARSSAAPADKAAYAVFPDPDAGADPSVPADQGGRGFTGEGWETNTDFDLIGDPRAVKGGSFREYQLDFPGTLRVHGPESNTALNGMIQSMVYEPLLTLHPTTLDYMPVIATHWQVSPDKLTYRYRIDPNARWSDGQPVTADDVVATWVLMMDKGLQDPSAQLTFGKFEQPVAESKYIVSVKSRQLNWRNFLYFSGMAILPAHVLKSVDGARYLKEYNFKLLPGTGPYTLNEADIMKGKGLTVRRRTDYWAEKYRRNVGLNNFDQLQETVVRDQNLAFEMFKKGDLDMYYVNISRQWVEELNFDRVQRGLIQKRKIFNDNPSGVQGLAINMRRPPFDDIRVRKAFTHLLNRELMIEKLFFNEYVPQNSYFPGGIYQNPNNPTNPYDPKLALSLLNEAGWKERDAQGRLVKDGRPLTVELLYGSKSSEPFLTIYQEDLRRVGIGISLRLVTPETQFQLVMERRFELVSLAWSGLLFPNPETSFHSKLADVDNNNNVSGVKDARIDELLAQYDVEFDQEKRVAIIREIDGIVANIHPYILEWDMPFQRIAFWNKFGHPEGYLTRIGDYRDAPSVWWIDAEKQAQLGKAMADASLTMPVGETEVRYWTEFARREAAPDAPAPVGTR
jgi:microcin C transport system substrate-binding protein